MVAEGGAISLAPLTRARHGLLMRLLEMPTAGPLEVGTDGPPPLLWEAQAAYAEAARAIGFVIAHHGTAQLQDLDRADVPLPVQRAIDQMPGFLDCQPSLVLRLGPVLPRAATVMFNVHLDTVAGWEVPRFEGGRFWGRGAVDAKGPAVALLAGVEAALRAEPALGTEVGVLIQAVAGEEGGAMGVYGTRLLIERGFVGRLNVFCEPTARRYLGRATASMTACIHVRGQDAIDDSPASGHNATVLLGFLAQHLAAALPGISGDARVCVAGLHTGTMHNRVYGSGRLLLNLTYGSAKTGRRLEAAAETAVHDGLRAFLVRFGHNRELALTASEAANVTWLEWLKRGLPALNNADPWAEWLLEREAGLDRWPDSEPAFTCDAIWMDGVPETATIIFGPGDLSTGNAHAPREHVEAAELERFADNVARMLTAFARDVTQKGDQGR